MFAGDTVTQLEAIIEPETGASATTAIQMAEERPPKAEESNQTSAPLKYGPLGLGDRRVGDSNPPAARDTRATIRNLDSEDELDSSSDESKKRSSPRVAYAPLELESDVESDLSSTEPRSRKRISGRDYDQVDEDPSANESSFIKRHFPNPDHYEDRRGAKHSGPKNANSYLDGSSKTSSFEFSKKGRESVATKRGDFNEVGIPIVDPFPSGRDGANTAHLKDVKTLIDRYEQNASQETLGEDQLSVRSVGDTRSRSESKIVSGIPLVAMVPGRSSSRGQSSSGFGSLPDVHDKDTGLRTERRATASPQDSAKGSRPTYRTDL